MAIKIFFEYNNTTVQLPVNPEELEIKGSGSNKTAEIVTLGQINILNPSRLKEIEIKGFLPAQRNLPYVLTQTNFRTPQQYIDFFQGIIRDKKSFLFVISDTKIHMPMSIESLDYKYVAGTDDMEYSLALKEYKAYSVRTVNVRLNANRADIAPAPPSGGGGGAVTVGSRVIVNGRLHRDSFGAGPGATEVNATRLVNFIKPGRSHPYHVTNLEGGWRGWVTAGSVRTI